MFGWRRGQKRPDSSDLEELVDEAAAFLLGRSPEIFWRRGERIPPWAWLNPLAHQEPSAVRAFARDAPGAGYREGSWESAMSQLAQAMVGLARGDDPTIRDLQDECLLPLELLLLTPVAPRIRTPRELLALALARVQSHQTSRHQD
ncbi:MAG: hypothetical protein ACYCU7_03415 [Acidimicrobiales bacterium]